jgi:hypothetical protein
MINFLSPFSNLFGNTPFNNVAAAGPITPACGGSKNFDLNRGKVFGVNTKIALSMTYDGLRRRDKKNLYHISYHEFETAMMWFLGNLIDIEDETWDPKAENPSTGAYGYFQILGFKNVDYIATALNRYKSLCTGYDALDPSKRSWMLSPAMPKGKMMSTVKFKKTRYYTTSQVFEDYIPKYPIFQAGTLAKRYVSGWDRLAYGILPVGQGSKARGIKVIKPIIDYYSSDLIAALVIANISQVKDSDIWLKDLTTNPEDAAFLIYLRAHHADLAYPPYSDTELLASAKPGVPGGATTAELKNTFDRAKDMIKCQIQSSVVSPKIGEYPKYGPSTMLQPLPAANACHGEIVYSDTHKFIDEMFATLNFKTGAELGKEYERWGYKVDDVTDHIPPDSKLQVGQESPFPMTHTYRIWRLNEKTKYITATDDMEGMKKYMRAKINKEVNATAFNAELLESGKVAFQGIHDNYVFGSIMQHYEPLTLGSFIISKADGEAIRSRGNRVTWTIYLGGKHLYPMIFQPYGPPEDNLTEVAFIYYPSPGFEDLIRNNRTFITEAGAEVKILNPVSAIIASLRKWAKDPELIKINGTNRYFKDLVADNAWPKPAGVIQGYYVRPQNEPQANIMIGDMTIMTLVTTELTQTYLHEVGGHRLHMNPSLGIGGGWGGVYGELSGILFSDAFVKQGHAELNHYYNNPGVKEARDAYTEARNNLFAVYATGQVPATPEGKIIYDAFTAADAAHDKALNLWNNPITKNLVTLRTEFYTTKSSEDEFMARMYGTLAMNRCLTFKADIWPVMIDMGITVVTEDLATEIDTIMRDIMKLDRRTYIVDGSIYVKYDPFSIEYKYKGEGFELPKPYHAFLGETGELVTDMTPEDGSRVYYALAYLASPSSDPEEFNTVKGLLGNLLMTSTVLGTEMDSPIAKVASTLYEVLYQAFQAITIGDVMAELADIEQQVGGIWNTPPDWIVGRYFKAVISTGHVWAGFDANGTFKIYRKSN